jgi:hypothetical protein
MTNGERWTIQNQQRAREAQAALMAKVVLVASVLAVGYLLVTGALNSLNQQMATILGAV